MGFANTLCHSYESISKQAPDILFRILVIVYVIFFIALFVRLLKSKNDLLWKAAFSLITFLIFVVVGIGIIFGGLILDEMQNQARASNYFELNAAIKNTCYLDPNHIHCPHNLQELIAIQNKDFSKIAKQYQIVYKYYPETNQYTLIVRDQPYGAIIFDPRLKITSLEGYDFKEVEVSKCGGDHIVNPPNFSGPWNLNSN